MKGTQSSSKLERKTVEKDRRTHMKGQLSKLWNLIPSRYSKEPLSQLDQLDQAIVYINNLKGRVTELMKKKLKLNIEGINENILDRMMTGLWTPVIEVRDLDSSLEVVLISRLHKSFTLSDIIGVLGEEGAEVMNANFSNVGDNVTHIIHSRVTSPRVGLETARVYERLKELVH
ncbi:transcription factor bHLH162-like [Tasmannia lanceolata]|uniref:transcription factor bHLH162-like n=1 Tax=Tasmannia lanceolata TaxID=3420 RepID=UPI004062FD5C